MVEVWGVKRTVVFRPAESSMNIGERASSRVLPMLRFHHTFGAQGEAVPELQVSKPGLRGLPKSKAQPKLTDQT